MRGAEKRAELTQDTGQSILANFEKFPQLFPQKSVVGNGKNEVTFFHSRPWVKVQLTRECGKKTTSTGSKVYLWLPFHRIHRFA